MAGVKTLADGNVAFWILAAKPAAINALTISTDMLGANAKNWSCNILASDFDLGPTGSETIDEKALCAKGNAQTFGLSQYGGGFTVFRYHDATTGLADPTDDALWAAVKNKGTTLYIVTRENGNDGVDAAVAGEEYRYFEVITDDPVRGDRTGYVKYRINCAVQNAALDKVFLAGA
jgi:hypothetical protein